MDLEPIMQLDKEVQLQILPALKILVDKGFFSILARANVNRIVDGRMDSDDEEAIAKEVRDVRQANRVLCGIEESAKQLFKEQADA